MSHFIDKEGKLQHVFIASDVHKKAQKENMSVQMYINNTYEANLEHGTAWEQIRASLGLDMKANTSLGRRAPTMDEILSGAREIQAAVVQGNQAPQGTESRNLFPIALIDMMELALQKDRTTDRNIFDKLVAISHSVNGAQFEQPLITYSGSGKNGPETARSQRIAQLAMPAAMVSFTTSDIVRKIPTTSIGIEISQEALRSTSLDIVGLTLARFNEVERDTRIYEALADCIGGDLDINTTGAIASTDSTTMNGAATSGAMTHKAWIKWLYRQRRSRQIDWVICDLDTYMKVESRTGRPGSNNYDPTLARVDVQATAKNTYLGQNVQFFLVDAAADGGPVAANTLVGIDSRYALAHASNVQADYQATEQFALRKSEALRMDMGEIWYRLHDNAWDSMLIN